MAIVKKRREFKVGLKPGYTLNGEIKEQQQDDNEVKYSSKKMEVTETYHQNGVIDNYHKKINEFKAVKSRENSKHKRVTNGAISLINTKSGKRLIMAKLLSSNLNNPSKVVIGLSKNKLAIGEKLPANENYFTVKDYKGKRVIYSADLVKEISEKFKLDFSNRTTITFEEVEYREYEDTTVAIITINNEEGNI